jgi:hypothetical protein
VCFPIILIIACFGALLGVSEEYSTSKVEFIGGAVSQYYVGIASLIIIFSLFCCFAAYRAYAVSSYSFSGKGFGVKRLLVFTQLELVGAAIGFWYLFASPILSTLTVFIPPLAFTIVALVRLQIATEFEFVQSPQFRNPPFSGFCSALCACGLPVEDFQHLFLVVWFCLLLLGMALSISLTYTPYIVGLAIPIYIAVVFNTFFPLLKYFYTLSWQWRDTLQVLSAVVLHFGFMVALYFYYADSAEQHVYIFGISGIYVPIAILLSAVLKAGVEGWRMSRYVSIVARVFLVVAIGVLVAAIIYFGWVVGAAILAGLVFLSVSAYMINAWIDQHYVFSTLLSVLAWILFSICILCGVGIGIQVSPFWGFTGSWYTIIAALLVWALGLYRQGAISSSGAPNPTPLLFSPSVFPVYRFAVNSNDVTASNAPVFLLYICMLLVLLWSVAAAVVEPAVGLGISALCITLAFVYTRWAQRAQASLFSETIAYLRFDLVEATRRRAIDLQMSANTQMLHALQLDGAVVDERGQSIVVNYASIVAREHRVLDSLQLTSLFPTHAAVDYSVLEYAVQQIDLMDRQRDALFEIEQQFIAHFVFLLVLATRASVVEDEARFARFRQWLSVNKPQWELDDHLTVDATLEWTDDECAVYRELKSEFEAFEARESAENARRRAEEVFSSFFLH